MTPTLRGIVLKIAAVSIFTVLMSFIKATSEEVPVGQAVFFRSLFTLLVIVGWLAATGHLHDGLKTQRPLGHLGRSLAGTIGMGCRFFALGALTFPEVTALGFTTPLILTLLAAWILGETVRAFRLTTVAIGFVGVVIILWPTLELAGERTTLQMWGGIAMLVSAFMAALAQIQVRQLVATEGTPQIVFYFALMTSVVSLCTAPFGWTWPPMWAFGLLVAAGVLGGIGQVCLTTAYRHAPASVVAPFDYTSMLLALAIGWWGFGEAPTWTMLVGAVVVIGSGALIVWREQRLGKLKRKAESAQG